MNPAWIYTLYIVISLIIFSPVTLLWTFFNFETIWASNYLFGGDSQVAGSILMSASLTTYRHITSTVQISSDMSFFRR